MAEDQVALTDPWCRWPNGFPYDGMAAGGVGVESSLEEIRDAFFDLMERGLVDDRVQTAYDELRITSRRLMVDALLYDPRLAPELLALLDNPPEDEIQQRPLNQSIPFSWDV